VSIRDGSNLGGTVLTTIVIPVLGDNDFPTGGFDQNWDPRGYGDSINTLNVDTITLTIPTGNGSDVRGSLAALKITAVPEPSAVLLGSVGLFGLLRRRR
jgi:PEP-CTERM motif